MTKHRIQKKDEEIGARARMMARQVLGKAYAGASGLHLIRGEPDFERLYDCLRRLKRPPTPHESPSPAELGFPSEGIREVRKSYLATHSRALQKWLKIIENRMKLKRRAPELKRKLERWEGEIAVISARLANLYEWSRIIESGAMPPSAPFLLPEPERSDLQTRLRARARGLELPPLWEWHYRVVGWAAGRPAAERFLGSIRPLLRSSQRNAEFRALQGLNESARARAKRLKQGEEETTTAYEAVRAAVDTLPRALIGGDRIPARLRRHDLGGQLQALVARCELLLKSYSADHPWIAAGLAALCACDRAEVVYSPRFFLAYDSSYRYDESRPRLRARLFRTLFAESRKPGYAELIAFLSRGRKPLQPRELGMVRQMLASGVGPADVEWLLDFGDTSAKQLAAKGLSPSPVRKLSRALRARGAPLDQSEVAGLLRAVLDLGSAKVMEAFAAWLSLIPKRAITPRLAGLAKASITGLGIPSLLSPQLRNFLDRWAAPRPQLPPMPGLPEDLPSVLQAALAQQAYYQGLSGKTPSLSRSVTKVLLADEREAKERAHLEGLERRGGLTGRMSKRLELLRSRTKEGAAARRRKLVRQVRQTCAHAALEALRLKIREESGRRWKEVVGHVPPEHLSPIHMAEICAWVSQLDSPKKDRLRALLGAHAAKGARYKESIPGNSGWLAKARREGVDVEAWLHPPPAALNVGGRRVRIQASPDPFAIFLMGSYFGTCLALRRGENRDTVLANAHDANKNVLLVRAADGAVLGRKLVCLNERLEMIGFRTYLSVGKKESGPLEDELAAYCGLWARRANVRLSNFGVPEGLSRLFWYDDGLEHWPESAHSSRGGEDTATAGITASPGGSRIHPDVLAVLEKRARDCYGLLQECGAWPEYEADPMAPFRKNPGLAEESLAILAKREGNDKLAELVFDHARSEGGRLEALTALARIGGERYIDELVGYGEDTWSDAATKAAARERAGRILMDLDTPRSCEVLTRLAFEDKVSSLWALAAMFKSPRAAAAVRAYVMGNPSWEHSPSYFILALDLAQERLGAPISDAILRKIILEGADTARDSEGGCRWNLKWLLDAVCWLSPFRHPKKSLSRDFLKRLEDIGQILGEGLDCPQDEALLTGIAALRNPCPASSRFLRERAEQGPVHLLCLALQSPRRFAQTITKAARTMPGRPAAAMAMFLCRGVDDGRRKIAEAWPPTPGQERATQAAAALFEAYQDLEFQGMGEIHKAMRADLREECLPLVLTNLWRHSDAVDAGEDPKSFLAAEPDQEPEGKRHRLPFDSAISLSIRLAQQLASADPERAAKLRMALHRVAAGSSPYLEDDAELIVSLDVLSGRRMFERTSFPYAMRSLHLGELCESGAFPLLLFGSDGHRTQLADMEWTSEYGKFCLPEDIQEVKRLLGLLREKYPPDRLKDFCAPATEIEKLLLKRCVEGRL